MSNNANGYGVTVLPAAPNAAGYVWRAADVQHVAAGRNGGNHHIYLDVYDEQGGEVRGNANVRVVWGWEGQRPDEPAPAKALDKPRGEHMTNIPMDAGQVIRCAVQGYDYPSDIVAGLHTNHPDEGDDVRRGHHSFVVTFRLMREAVQPPPVVQPPTPVQPPQPPAPDDERAGIAAGLRRVAGVLEGAAVDLRHLAAAVECQGEAKG